MKEAIHVFTTCFIQCTFLLGECLLPGTILGLRNKITEGRRTASASPEQLTNRLEIKLLHYNVTTSATRRHPCGRT